MGGDGGCTSTRLIGASSSSEEDDSLEADISSNSPRSDDSLLHSEIVVVQERKGWDPDTAVVNDIVVLVSACEARGKV